MKLARLWAPALALVSGLAAAQNLDMPTGEPYAALPDRPTRGSTMSQVEARFGTPASRHAAVGNPPITRWDYPQFAVFFEHDKVLHAVVVRTAGN
jgi:hypothetical protein